MRSTTPPDWNLLARAVALVGIFAAMGTPAQAELRLASPFGDHMVLQQRQPVPVWGTGAAAGARVTVRLRDQRQTTTADAEGRWSVRLKPMPAGGPHELIVDDGAQRLLVGDVLIGEVWLCSGQSNMDFTVAKTAKYYFAGVNNEAEEVAAADYPRLRMFTGEWTRSYQPQREVAGTWKICTPESVREFSAIGYFFARDLQKALGVPVGIVTLTYGASTAQAWIRREAIAADPQLRATLEDFDDRVKAYVPLSDEELRPWQKAADKARAAGQRPPRHPRPDPVQDQHNPTVMWNGMIAPIVPFAVRGVLWYQGESITGPRELFPRWNETLIRDWRRAWRRELPFYFCQLAALEANSNNPDVREMQAEALRLPRTAMAVTIDIGDRKNVHPANKQEVAARLARIALAKDYGRDIESSGPTLRSVRTEGARLRLKFAHTGGGLVARGGALKTFEVAGADGVFVPAEALIDGEAVLVTAAAVAAPVAARYAWANYPEGCNLYNAAGLPAAPFRTNRAKSR